MVNPWLTIEGGSRENHNKTSGWSCSIPIHEEEYWHIHFNLKDPHLVTPPLKHFQAWATQPKLDLSGMPIEELTSELPRHIDTLILDHSSIKSLDSFIPHMNLKSISLNGTMVSDLSPLQGCDNFEHLYLNQTRITNLMAISQLPIKTLHADHTRLSDLSPLANAPITHLSIEETWVDDISSLKGKKMKHLNLEGSPIASLKAIQGQPIHFLNIDRTHIKDLSPLSNMPLRKFVCDPKRIYKNMKTVADMDMLLTAGYRDFDSWKDWFGTTKEGQSASIKLELKEEDDSGLELDE